MSTLSPQALPPIPVKRYFTIAETCALCGVEPHVLRHWEQEFSQLSLHTEALKKRMNRRNYQHHELQLIRRIRHLLYDEGFSLAAARNHLGASNTALAPLVDKQEGVRLSGVELQSIRQRLHAVKAELEQALSS